MSIRINENIFSLFVNRNLQRTGTNLDQAFRRLSSGEKITRSGDDPAGLANSQALRAKVAGLQRNLINANEGVNLFSVAESSLGNMTDILQRMRELAIQASSSTLGTDQRAMIQEETDSLLEEIQRIATTANYNDRKLLDGSFSDLRLQVGTRMDESIPLTIDDARISILGSVARATGAGGVSAAPLAGNGDLSINGVSIPASAFDGVSSTGGDASARAKAAAINSVSDRTGVQAVVNATAYSLPGAVLSGGSLDGTASALYLNGVNIGALDFLAGDSNNALRQKINSYSTLTGVEARVGAGGELVLEAKDGRNLEIRTTGNMAAALGLQSAPGDLNTVERGRITLESPRTIQVGGDLGLIGWAAGQSTTFVDPGTAIENLRLLTFEDAQKALATIDVAQKQILERRAALGAVESRIGKTIEDLMVNIENLTAADSRIRDADFAVETASLSQAQIIQQAGISILAQANVIPQMALSLLQK